MRWFYQSGGHEVGPVTAKQLRVAAFSGEVTPDTPVRRECDAKWSIASNVNGLFDDATDNLQPTKPVDDSLEDLAVEIVTAGAGNQHTEDDTKPCPFCAEFIKREAIKCCHCGESLVPVETHSEAKAPRRINTSKKSQSGVTLLQLIGIALLVCGCIAAFGFYTMDTSVEVPRSNILGTTIGGNRVHNIGLMEDKRNGLIASLAAIGSALLMVLFGGQRR